MNKNARLSRRNFIRASGLSLGLAVASPFSPLATAFASSNLSLKIGILLPQSTLYPALGEQFLAGFQGYFAHTPQVKWKVAPIEQSFRSITSQAEVLCQQNVDLLVGVVGSRMLPLLKDFLTEQQIFFVASNLGENAPRPEENHPYLIHNSLHYWRANWALGEWAAQELGNRAILATTAYDSGYDAFSAFRVAFEHAGGQVEHLHIHDVSTPQQFEQALQNSQPDFVYAAYSGQAASDFVVMYSQIGSSIPLVGSPFLAEFANDATIQTSDLGLPPYEGVSENPFAILGYQAAMQAASWQVHRKSMFDYQTHSPSYYLREVGAGQDQLRLELPVINLPFAESHLRIGQSGWVNAYLSI